MSTNTYTNTSIHTCTDAITLACTDTNIRCPDKNMLNTVMNFIHAVMIVWIILWQGCTLGDVTLNLII